MSDLISKQKLLDTIKPMVGMWDEGAFWIDYRRVIDIIEDFPNAEPERKTGEWIDGMPYVNSHWKVCSECHESAPDSCGGYNFCPYCGADMRGDR